MKQYRKELWSAYISRITIVNEVSSLKVSIEAGKEIKSFFVIEVVLKRKDYDEKNIITISKLIPQNLIMVLIFENKAKIAVYHTKLMQTDWKLLNELSIKFIGLDLDKVWENIIIQIGNLKIEQGNSLKEQIILDEKRTKIKKEIKRLEKIARNEVQPKKKFDIVNEIKKLTKQLSEVN